MSSFVKYKIREVAKDFDMPTKSVMNMVTEHFEAPKSSAQVLSDDQLNLVFDLITRPSRLAFAPSLRARRLTPNPWLLAFRCPLGMPYHIKKFTHLNGFWHKNRGVPQEKIELGAISTLTSL